MVSQEVKGIIGVVTSVISTTIVILIITPWLTKKAADEAISQYVQSQTQKKLYGISTNPKLKLEILTSEYYDNNWNPVIMHTFYGDTEKELNDLVNSHRQTDTFFDASFIGTFKWKGSTLKLKNTERLTSEV